MSEASIFVHYAAGFYMQGAFLRRRGAFQIMTPPQHCEVRPLRQDDDMILRNVLLGHFHQQGARSQAVWSHYYPGTCRGLCGYEPDLE